MWVCSIKSLFLFHVGQSVCCQLSAPHFSHSVVHITVYKTLNKLTRRCEEASYRPRALGLFLRGLLLLLLVPGFFLIVLQINMMVTITTRMAATGSTVLRLISSGCSCDVAATWQYAPSHPSLQLHTHRKQHSSSYPQHKRHSKTKKHVQTLPLQMSWHAIIMWSTTIQLDRGLVYIKQGSSPNPFCMYQMR